MSAIDAVRDASERAALLAALVVTRGNRTTAGIALGLSYRQVVRLIREHDLSAELDRLAVAHGWLDDDTRSSRALRVRAALKPRG